MTASNKQNTPLEKDSILILSGGVDSVTMLYDFKERIALAISFDYGSNHNSREIPFARLHCERLAIRHIVIPLAFMGEYFKSSLLSGADDIPEGNYADENMKSTVVPFRNGIMLSVAVGMAESAGLKHVMMANHGGDHTIYPDCRPEFVSAFSAAAEAGTYAATGNGKQSPIILVVKDPEVRSKLAKLNAAVMGMDIDPFYGAPELLIVLANKEIPTYIYDGTLVMGNLMNAAADLGVASCWVHRAKEEFESEEGKAILKALGIEGDYEGIGNLILGYAEKPTGTPAPRKADYVYTV